MSSITKQFRINCADDCKSTGCPGHNYILHYFSTSDSFSYRMLRRKEEDLNLEEIKRLPGKQYIEVALLDEIVNFMLDNFPHRYLKRVDK